MATAVKHDVREITWPQRTFITKRAVKGFNELSGFFGENYGAIYGALAKMGIQPKEMPCAFYYSIDEKGNQTDLAAAVPVPESTPDIAGFTKIIIPPTKVITATHTGSYESMGPTYTEMDNYLEEHNLHRDLIIEEYCSDPAVEKDPAKWKTNIYFLLK